MYMRMCRCVYLYSFGTETMLSSQLAASLFYHHQQIAISPVQPFECHICYPISKNSNNNNNSNNTMLKDNCAHIHTYTHISRSASVRACCAKSHSHMPELTCKQRYSANMRTGMHTCIHAAIHACIHVLT